MDLDQKYMDRALMLARKGEGRTSPNPPVGAVIVSEGKIVGKGFHPKAGEPHAEIFALRQAGEQARGAVLYVTLEPCSHFGRTGPCAEAVVKAGLARVVVGIQDPNPAVAGRGIARLREAGIEVQVGCRQKVCSELIAPFAKHVNTGLPYVILKTAITLDGKTASSTGDSKWVSGESSRRHVHHLRDRCDAIVVGSGTVLADNPQLTTRLPEGGRDPLRIVVDSKLGIPADAALLHLDSNAQTLIATTSQAPEGSVKALQALGAEILVCDGGDGRVDLRKLFFELGKRSVQSVLLEGGGVLNHEMMRCGLVDRMMVFIAPKVLGGSDGKGIFDGCGPLYMSEASRLTNISIHRFEDDILIEGDVEQCSPA